MLMRSSPTAALRPLAFAIALVAAVPLAIAQDQPAAPAAAATAPIAPETVVATVNGKPITEADLQFAIQDYAADLAQIPPQAHRRVVLDVLVDTLVIAEAAEKDGVTDSEAFKQRLAFMTMQAERNAYVDQKVTAGITDAELKARYDQELAKFSPPEEIHARHILVETEDEAKAIIKDLEGGADFATIAKEKSKDPGSGAEGGDLGFFARGQMVPPFEEAAFALEVGQITKTPVKSDFGWHVIKLEEKRKQEPPPFDQIKDQIRTVLLREKFAELLTGLKENAKVEIVDPSLKSTPMAAPPVPLPGATDETDGDGEEPAAQ